MRANDHVSVFVAFNQRQKTFFLTRRSSDRQFHAERFEPTLQHSVVLFGQNLSRRHERCLIAGLNCEQDRGDRNHGFSRADVPLQKAIHRKLRGQVTLDFGDDFFLGGCQFKWKYAQKFLH